MDPLPLVDEDLELILVRTAPGDSSQGLVPQYEFELRLTGRPVKVGHIHFRVGYTEKLDRFGGNLGYGVDENFRGHNYAARGCRLLFHLAKRHGLKKLWITCSPENTASRRTCELMGAYYVDTIDAEIEPGKYRPTCRFIVDLGDEKLGQQTNGGDAVDRASHL
jgi:tagatose 1,6-diphosphate aldolase